MSKDSGSLRVIPGSHRWGDNYADELDATFRGLDPAAYGTSQSEIPAVALESQPGDVCVFIQVMRSRAVIRHAVIQISKQMRLELI